jgi:hypothetical protein
MRVAGEVAGEVAGGRERSAWGFPARFPAISARRAHMPAVEERGAGGC